MPIDPRHPKEIRADIRRGKLSGITAGLGQNFVQANQIGRASCRERV